MRVNVFKNPTMKEMNQKLFEINHHYIDQENNPKKALEMCIKYMHISFFDGDKVAFLWKNDPELWKELITSRENGGNKYTELKAALEYHDHVGCPSEEFVNMLLKAMKTADYNEIENTDEYKERQLPATEVAGLKYSMLLKK